jgi:glycosyltransferase involved in cell wall biosynthesis
MIIDGKNGIHVNEGDAQALARVIDDLAMNPERVIQLRRGITPPRSMEDHRQALDDVYKSVKSGARRA